MNRLKLLAIILLVCQLGFASACVTKEVSTTETYYITDNTTEYKTESYTETENVVVRTTTGQFQIKPSSQWNNAIWWLEGLGSSDNTFYYGYDLFDTYGFDSNKHSRSQVKITISSIAKREKGSIIVYDLSGRGQIPIMESLWEESTYLYIYKEWLKNLQSTMENARVLGKLETGAAAVDDKIVFDAKGVDEFAIFVNSYIFGAVTDVELTWWDDIMEQRTVTKQRQMPYQAPAQIARQRTVIKQTQVPFWEALLNK